MQFDIKKFFSLVLKIGRAGTGLTQEQLAEAAGVTEQLVCEVERMERNVTIEKLQPIIDRIDVSAAGLIEAMGIDEPDLKQVMKIAMRLNREHRELCSDLRGLDVRLEAMGKTIEQLLVLKIRRG